MQLTAKYLNLLLPLTTVGIGLNLLFIKATQRTFFGQEIKVRHAIATVSALKSGQKER